VVNVKRLSYQFGAEPERKPVVLAWRFGTRQVKDKLIVPEREVLKKTAVAFGRRTFTRA
jgi:hypothetical protein